LEHRVLRARWNNGALEHELAARRHGSVRGVAGNSEGQH
jgi:hypothetical protein